MSDALSRRLTVAALVVGALLGSLLIPTLVAQQPVTIFGPVVLWDGVDTANINAGGQLNVDSEMANAATFAANFANPSTTQIVALNAVWDGATWDPASPSLLTEATEDATATAAGIGTYPLTQRLDAQASSANADTDNAYLITNSLGALYTQTTAGISGGAAVHYRTAAGSTEDEHEIKSTPGTYYGFIATNTNAAARYLRCYNLTAANTTPGSSTVFFGMAIPGNTAGAGAAMFVPVGLAFSVALTCTLTTGAADTDTTEVAASEIKINHAYK